MPRPRSSQNRRDYRGFLSSANAAALASSADSGAALESVAPALAPAAAAGGDSILPLVFIVAALAALV